MHLFDRDISCEKKDGFDFTGTIAPNWSINGNPNGGYLLAIVAEAMQQVSEKKLPVIITANFLSRSIPDTADVAVETISQGKQFNRLQAKLVQEGKETIRAMGTFAAHEEKGTEKRYERSAPDIAPRDSCVLIPEFPNYSLYTQMDTLLDPSCAGWMEGRLADKSEQKGWIKFKDDRSFDALSLLLMADAFPPPVLASQGMVAWVPTIEYSVNIRTIPVTRWLKGVFRSRFINNGIVEEDGELWDENGELVAISRQVAQFRKNT